MQAFRVLSEWSLRAFLRTLLKRNLGQILATDLDLEQLSVKLDTRSLELKDCLLDAKYLNEQLASGVYEIESALIGRISVNFFDFRIVVEDVVVILKQRDEEHNEPANFPSKGHHFGVSAESPSYNDKEAQGIARTAIDEGVAGLSSLFKKTLLKKLELEGRGFVIKAKLAKGQLLTINLDSIAILDADEGGIGSETACVVAKACSFSGLGVQLTSSDSTDLLASISYESTGCGGNIVVDWMLDAPRSLTIDARASFNGVCVWMSPAAVPVIVDIVEVISRIKPQSESNRNSPTSDHPLSRSMLVAEAASSRNILKALTLPDGERLFKEELARLSGGVEPAGEEEFFYSVTDVSPSSFFSAASTVFGEARSRPPSPIDEPSSPLQIFFGSSDQVSPSGSLNVLQLKVEVSALELWLACRSELIGSADPWYLRLNMQGLSLSQVHELSCTALTTSINSIDISEYTPIEANRSKLHDIGQFEALFESFARHCDLPNIQRYFHEEAAFAETIRRLEHLQLAGRNYWCRPDNYEMSPIIACAATGNHPAFSLIVERSGLPPCALSARVLLLEVHSWLNAPMVARMEELLSAGFSSRTSEAQLQQGVSLDLDFSLYLSTLTLCFFAPNAAIAIQLSGDSIDDLFSDFNRTGPRWNQAGCPPFLDLQCKSEETVLRSYATRAQIYNLATEGAGSSIEVVEGGCADALSISCALNIPLDLQALSADLPDSIAILLDRRNITTASEIKIAGDVLFILSPVSLRSVTEIASSFSAFSRPPNNSGAFKLHINRFTLQFLGPLVLDCNDIQMMHLIEIDGSSMTIGSSGKLTLRGDSEWPYISTSGCERRPVIFAIADRYREVSQPVEKQLTLHMAGIVLAEDFLREKQVWSEFEYLRNTPVESPGDATAQSFAVSVLGNDLMILHIPSNDQVAVGVYLQALSVASREFTEFSDIKSHIRGVSIYLREGGVTYTAPSLPFSTWLQQQGYLLTAREEEVHLERRLERFSTISLLPPESISLRTGSLHTSINKGSAALIKKLFAELQASHKPSEEAYEEEYNHAPEIDADTIGEALGLDVRGSDEPQAPLNGAWYEKQDLGVEDISGSLGPEELRQCSFPTSAACVGGNGAWLSSYEYIRDYVRPKEVTARCNRSRDVIPTRVIVIASGSITVVLSSTVSAQGADILKGSVQVKVENTKASLRLYHGINSLNDCAFSIQRLSMRHDIHPLAAPSSQWHDVFTCPQLRNKGLRDQLVAFSCEVESSKTQSGRADLVVRVNCSPVQVRLDQYLLLFAREFGNSLSLDTWRLKVIEEDEEVLVVQSGEPPEAERGGESAYIQRFHIAGFALKIIYVPNFVDMGALRKGSYMELLNMVPKYKGSFWLRELEICGAESFSSLIGVIEKRWKQDIWSVSIAAILKTLKNFAALPANPSKKTLEHLQETVLALLRILATEGREVTAPSGT